MEDIGIEPMTPCLQGRCSPKAELIPRILRLVPSVGLEPTRPRWTPTFEDGASANSATRGDDGPLCWSRAAGLASRCVDAVMGAFRAQVQRALARSLAGRACGSCPPSPGCVRHALALISLQHRVRVEPSAPAPRILTYPVIDGACLRLPADFSPRSPCWTASCAPVLGPLQAAACIS